ncbi:MAG: hypothetical protein CM15mP120_16290 [Pseudomonadota bacterium]|nr:MAG: hypothetical protein CM15mP120_16290 [Pseudomonadota bacterium]
MASGKLSSVLKLFDNDPTPEEQDVLKREVMLLVLARATAADTNIKDVEIEKVREVLTAHLNTEFDASEVRVAANSELYERAPLKRFCPPLRRACVMMTKSRPFRPSQSYLCRRPSKRLRNRFFNEVAIAMSLTPAEIMGLQQEVSVRGS